MICFVYIVNGKQTQKHEDEDQEVEEEEEKEEDRRRRRTRPRFHDDLESLAEKWRKPRQPHRKPLYNAPILTEHIFVHALCPTGKNGFTAGAAEPAPLLTTVKRTFTDGKPFVRPLCPTVKTRIVRSSFFSHPLLTTVNCKTFSARHHHCSCVDLINSGNSGANELTTSMQKRTSPTVNHCLNAHIMNEIIQNCNSPTINHC